MKLAVNWHLYVAKIHHHLALVAAAVGGLAVVVVLVVIAIKRRPRPLKPEYFQQRWRELQKNLSNKKTWPLAIIDADKLLDEALKKRRFKGKTMGERLVSAQHSLSSNDMVWFGHKLRNKLVHEDYKLTSKAEVRDALLGYLQALKDLGAMRRDK